jgi:transposase
LEKGSPVTSKGSEVGMDFPRFHDRSCPSARPWREKKALPEGQSIGKSRGGPTTKIHLICDDKGRPLHFRLTPGNIHDVTVANLMLDELPGDAAYTVADKGYDSDAIREKIIEMGSEPVIPYKKNRKEPGKLKKKIYRYRHRVENVFCSLKQYRGVATRYEKLSLHFAGIVAMASVMLWLKIENTP